MRQLQDYDVKRQCYEKQSKATEFCIEAIVASDGVSSDGGRRRNSALRQLLHPMGLHLMENYMVELEVKTTAARFKV